MNGIGYPSFFDELNVAIGVPFAAKRDGMSFVVCLCPDIGGMTELSAPVSTRYFWPDLRSLTITRAMVLLGDPFDMAFFMMVDCWGSVPQKNTGPCIYELLHRSCDDTSRFSVVNHLG